MSITPISANDPPALQSFFGQPQQDLRAMANDLGSGNLAGAQKDFASLQKDVSIAFQAMNNATGSVPASTSPAENSRAADLQALQGALNANDLAAAQKSFAAFQQDVRAFGMQRGHHRHRHPMVMSRMHRPEQQATQPKPSLTSRWRQCGPLTKPLAARAYRIR
jgi:hypothetical protein